ncbi:MAG TPA: hypothetical protein VGH66_13990 [Acidimicrobiales bacterium]|jgi:hypothetical protein
MAQAPAVQVVGLKALSRDLGKMSGPNGALLKAMQLAGSQAVEPVAAATRAGLPQDTGRLAGDVRVSATRSGAAVRMGRPSIRYAGWVEFGGTRKAPHTSTRPYQALGRYMFPRARELAGAVAARYSTAVGHVLENYGWTNQGGSVHD